MFVYLYDKNTKEYLTSMEADKDPEETLLQGKFVPLLPANSTLMVPPVYNLKNEIPVYKNEKWVIEADYRKNFYKVNDDLQVETVKTIGEQIGFYIVDKNTGEEIKQDPGKFKIINKQVVRKTNKEYEQEQAQKEKERIAQLNLTAADVERAIYRAKGMDFDDVVALVENSRTSEIDVKALKIELRANNFYRGSEWVTTVGAMLGFTKTQLDDFFETNDYTKLLTESEVKNG